ncbi:MAG: FtsX-like permease family protein [Thermoanaerobaculales bacterium]|nr:FtsX-like permease family protein [Thermoanaerobaculales bacterium]
MEFGPIFRALLNNRTRFWLIIVEVALTLAIVVNCTSIFLEKRRSFNSPTGMDVENILVINTEPFGEDFAVQDFVKDVGESDLARLRSRPSIINATPIHHIPLSGSGSSTGRKAAGSELDTVGISYFSVDEHGIETLGVELIDGRNFNQAEIGRRSDGGNEDMPRNVIVTKAFAERVFPDGNVVGSQISNGDDEYTATVIGVIDLMSNCWPRSSIGKHTMLQPSAAGDSREMNYLVRAEPGAIDTLYTELEELMISLETDRVVRVRTLSEIKLGYYSRTLMAMKIWAAVIVLMIIVTSLGIVGLTSFSVTQRTREIGTRRALGATRSAILRYFLIENWLITGIGLAIGTALTILLNYVLAEYAAAPKIDWILLVGGAAVLWAAGLLSALIPALRAITVTPEIATRSV